MATATKVKAVKVDEGYEVVSTPPEFVKRGGKPASALRRNIEALDIGEWLNTRLPGTAQNKNNVRGMVQGIAKAELTLGQRYAVRVAADEENTDGIIWVGRTV